ncbi:MULTISPECIES: response regulator transcription factor [unclassified Meiothermus]|uniref:response regulator transcription factor n=1 Tax=unclassified Meiothermus TaxID=370471 RepID=UPI000D7C0C82|nr:MULTISPECIES: response regulator transcription factor [unclassified Meiothermus]PZA05918.1 DNA-binding response regulator [Meiothermus sp. Pnk-1]RYM39399.1 response regulator transcription factor [Meiothermus sp. PNK-Is4]
MIRLLLAEDQGLVRGALRALLELEDDLTVVAEAGSGAEALELARRHLPDVAILDIQMPGMDGLEAAAQLRRECPGVKVIILTTFARAGFLERALKAGVLGYLLKDSPAEKLAEAVRAVVQGQRMVDPELALEALAEPNPLSERERQILLLAERGLSSKEIASHLNLSEGTVRNYLSEALSKLGAKNRLEGLQIARAKGWL